MFSILILLFDRTRLGWVPERTRSSLSRFIEAQAGYLTSSIAILVSLHGVSPSLGSSVIQD